MAKSPSALEFLSNAVGDPPPAVCAIFGSDAFLKRQVVMRLRQQTLAGDEGEFSLSVFPGPTVEWRDVNEELATVAMFGGDRRLVLVEDADAFVARCRQQLEAYVERPSRTAVFALVLDSFPSNTRLYKVIAAAGWLVDCTVPAGARLSKWLAEWAGQVHKLKLSGGAAELLVELTGGELGLIDQELAKLAPLAGADRRITPELVTQMVGGWGAKTAWAMLDAALDGNTTDALTQLDRLLASAETPVGLLGMIASSLRRLAAATRLVLHAEASQRRTSLTDALGQAGVKGFFVTKAERQLRRLGRVRARQLYRWLLAADLDLKGGSALAPRVILERLLVNLAVPAGTASTPRK